MAEALNRLTAMQISRLTAPGYYPDGGRLWLQVTKTGNKSWIFRFDLDGKRYEMGLGGLRDVTLQESRRKAVECRKQLADGKNPLIIKRAEREARVLEAGRSKTFDDCATAYIAAHRDSWKNDKHVQQWENTIKVYAKPKIGSLPVASVDTALITKILSPIWKTKTVTAKRLRARIENILDWAKVAGYRSGENPARWKGHLDKMLASPGKVSKTAHFAALPWSDVGAFMVELRKQQGIAARGVELAILTAARSGEIRGATWAEFDLDSALWTIPSKRMKAGREHRIPLSKQAVAMLKAMPRFSDDRHALVFPGAKEGKPLSDMSLTAVLRRMGRDEITVHGFRSTFRDWCAEASSFPRAVAEHALAHRLPDKTEAAYQRGDLIEKRTLLMQAWANYCDKPAAPAKVIPFVQIATA